MPDKELIYREDLIAEYDRVHIGAAGGARKLMVDAPAVDAVEVVRCEDCKYGYFYCGSVYCGNAHTPWYNNEFDATMKFDDFCSYGERKCQSDT